MRHPPLTIPTVHAGRPVTKTIYPARLTGIERTSLGDAIAVCYHGEENHLYLSATETIDFVRVCWQPGQKCRFYRGNACWGARQASDVPSGCIGCRLRRILLDATREDLRASLPNVPRSPLWPSFLIATAFLAQAFWFGQIGQTAMARAARAERELARVQATFKRQTGDKRR
jgi:hypothetical protein